MPGCREIVQDGENGLLVPARNANALAAALLLLIQSPSLRKWMGERGRARVETEYGVETVVGQTLALYTDEPR